MTEYREQNAKILSTCLGIEDHGFFTPIVHLDYGGTQQGWGNYALTDGWGISLLRAVLETVGAEKWEQLPGKHCRSVSTYMGVAALGHIIEDRWPWMDQNDSANPVRTGTYDEMKAAVI